MEVLWLKPRYLYWYKKVSDRFHTRNICMFQVEFWSEHVANVKCETRGKTSQITTRGCNTESLESFHDDEPYQFPVPLVCLRSQKIVFSSRKIYFIALQFFFSVDDRFPRCKFGTIKLLCLL